MKKILEKFPFWLLDLIGKRVSDYTYLGHGDFEEERYFVIGKYWISAESYINKTIS